MFKKSADAEKKKAKEQDKMFVEYRKDQILREIRPSNKAFDLKKFDESFPRERAKYRKEKMEYGELMHNYLNLRPDGRFATWYGKTAKKPSDRSIRKIHAPNKKHKKEHKNKKEQFLQAMYDYIQLQDEVNEDEDVDRERILKAYDYMPRDEVDSKNKYLLNAIVDDKPFWTVGDAKLVHGNTLQSIVDTIAKTKIERKNNRTAQKVKFNDKVRCMNYMIETMPVEKTPYYFTKLENIIRK